MPERQNDPSINNSERLWRRVHPSQIDWTLNPPRVRKAAFNTRDGLSVSIASETTIEILTRDYPQHSVVEFEAGFARSLGCTIERDPTPEDPAHALVFGPKSRGQLNQTQLKNLRDAATLKLYKWPTQETPPSTSSESEQH